MKIPNLFNKNKAIKRYVRSHIVHSVPHSSALKNILSIYYQCVDINQLESLGQKVQGWILFKYLFKTRTAKHKKTSQVSVTSFMMKLYMLFNCKKRNRKYCVSRAKLFTSGDIELNPGPAKAFNVVWNNQPPCQLAKSRCRTTNNNETIAVAKEQKRKVI
ncbi:hypothetical protein P5673_029612 [Acropora cervicornis]|uniref:Uncharacterized protein n=1 Tax=Acropora cervicornis TaxID=6130 RepID=A0AAD9PVQ5_ACRCE|nr:hypothetical protein P5673_029612 [Acropora cervicornis]